MYSLSPFQIVIASLAACLGVEFLNWLLVYRRKSFKNVKTDALVLQGKLDSLKEAGKANNDKQVKRLQEQMQRLSAQLYIFRVHTMVINLVLIGGLWRTLSRTYKGVPVAKLPFVPFGIFTRMTHSGLPGDDLTDASFHFIYILSSMAIRSCAGKFINRSSTEVMSKLGPGDFMTKYQEQLNKRE